MAHAAQNNLFKFMAVRPVQTADPEKAALRTIRIPGNGTPYSEFTNVLSRSATWADAQELARAHLRSTPIVGARADDDADLRVLRQIHSAAKAAAANEDVTGFRKRASEIQSAAPGFRSDAVTTPLWDALIAAYVSPQALRRDSATLIEPLRANHLIQMFDRLKSIEQVSQILRARPLIPMWVIDIAGKKGGGGAGSRADDRREKLDEVNRLRREVVAIDRTVEAIELGYAAAQREPGRASRVTEPVAAPEGDVRRVLSEDTESAAPWSGIDRAAAKLDAAATAHLDSVDRGWRYKSRDQLLDTLDRQRAALTGELERKGGRKATEGVRARTSGATLENPSLVDLAELDPVPIGSFTTGTIEGSVGTLRPVGYGDLLVVKETLLGYQDGEVSYVENVMKGESRQRVHRQLDRLSQTTFTATETVEETERDLQSTDRYEMATETQETVRNEVALDTGVNVSSSFGPVVQVDASADFSVSTATETATSASTNFAQEVVDHTVSKLTQTIKEEVTVRMLTETEETNTHAFENKTADHIVGVYRWQEKVYESQVYNYGKRFMFEFIVPEPAAFYKAARDGDVTADLEPPVPLDEDFSFEDLAPSRYQKWVDRYRVSNVAPPPRRSIVSGKVLEMPETTHNMKNKDYSLTTKSDSVSIAPGYLAKEAWVRAAWTSYELHKDESRKFTAVVGQHRLNKLAGEDYATLDDEETVVPVGVIAMNIGAYVLTVEVRAERSRQALSAWQLETYKAIVDAYNGLQSAYDAAVEAKRTVQGSTAATLSEDVKRGIEHRELKKGCLELFTDQHFHDFDATVGDAEPYGYPEFKISEAIEEGRYAQFFEQCFEWEQMTYVFYPYFWGRKSHWIENSREADSDPIFESFLAAGAARVLVPVRPGYELAVGYYTATGKIWNGGEAPGIDDELWVSVVDEIAESQDVSLSEARPYGEPWRYTLPTSLVKLQQDATLPAPPES